MKIPAYYSQHWKDGSPSGVWWLEKGDKAGTPDISKMAEGFFVIYHPEQELEINSIQVHIERINGLAHKIKEYKPKPQSPKKWWQFWCPA